MELEHSSTSLEMVGYFLSVKVDLFWYCFKESFASESLSQQDFSPPEETKVFIVFIELICPYHTSVFAFYRIYIYTYMFSLIHIDRIAAP